MCFSVILSPPTVQQSLRTIIRTIIQAEKPASRSFWKVSHIFIENEALHLMSLGAKKPGEQLAGPMEKSMKTKPGVPVVSLAENEAR
jgi:hypothetical protein